MPHHFASLPLLLHLAVVSSGPSPSGSPTSAPCTAPSGYYCSSSVSTLCPVGFYCLGGVGAAGISTPCFPATACPLPGLSSPLPCAWTASTLAGGGGGTSPGSSDGSGTSALFTAPSGLGLSGGSSLLVADNANNLVRRVALNASATVTTVSGSGAVGSADGPAGIAQFNQPVAVVSSGTMAYVSDSLSNAVRAVAPTGAVTTLAGGGAGGGGAQGFAGGTGTAALFYSPAALAVNGSLLLVADSGNAMVRVVNMVTGAVGLLAGGGGCLPWSGASPICSSGYLDSAGTAALFYTPSGVAINGSGTVIIADFSNNLIRLVSAAGVVRTLAGGGGSGGGGPTAPGASDGMGTSALFNGPAAVTVDALGNVFVADSANNAIRLISPIGYVSTIAGGVSGSANGVGAAAGFSTPVDIQLGPTGIAYIADSGNNLIRVLQCVPCIAPPGFYCSGAILFPCPGGTFLKQGGASSAAACQQCPGGHYCPSGTASWAPKNCGRGSYCPTGSAAPIPCPAQIPPPPYNSWTSHPTGAQGPAFVVETAGCRAHCFWNFTSADGLLSKC